MNTDMGTDTYNDRCVSYARDETVPELLRRLAVYAASKTEGEREAWKWVKQKKLTTDSTPFYQATRYATSPLCYNIPKTRL